MRELIISFNDVGMLREINEERNYYLCEAEEIISNIRNRLMKGGKVLNNKPFELFIDGEQIIVSYISFNDVKTLEHQIIETINNYDGWDNENKHKYINKIKSYKELEKQLFLNKEFKVFAIRFDQAIGNSDVEPFPLLLNIEQLKKMFDEVSRVSSSFYSELEEIINAIKFAYATVISLVIEEIENVDFTFEQQQNKVLEFFKDEKKFMRFIQYVSACYKSVSHYRIDALCARSVAYQDFQTFLFKDITKEYGFKKAYKIHQQLIKQFDKKFNDILFEGFVIKTDDMVESLVIDPVIKQVREEIEMEPTKV